MIEKAQQYGHPPFDAKGVVFERAPADVMSGLRASVCATSELEHGMSSPVKSCQVLSSPVKSSHVMAGPGVCATSMRKVERVVFDILGKVKRRACVRMRKDA
jgi:hypothetical protein